MLLAEINYDLWVAVGAILSGAGSVIMGMVALRMAGDKKAKDEASKSSDVGDGGGT